MCLLLKSLPKTAKPVKKDYCRSSCDVVVIKMNGAGAGHDDKPPPTKKVRFDDDLDDESSIDASSWNQHMQNIDNFNVASASSAASNLSVSSQPHQLVVTPSTQTATTATSVQMKTPLPPTTQRFKSIGK